MFMACFIPVVPQIMVPQQVVACPAVPAWTGYPHLLGRTGPQMQAFPVKAGTCTPPAPAQPDCLTGHIWELACEAEGCRAVQQALEQAPSDAIREEVASELKGHVWQAMRHRHANHVLQKCILTMRPAAVQFVIDEFEEKGAEGIIKAARHAFGCRIMQRLYEHCRPDQLRGVTEIIMQESVLLSKHVYGNFVVQHLAEYGTDSQRRRLSAELADRAAELGADVHSGAVLAKLISNGSDDEQAYLASALLREEGCLAALAKSRHGSAAVRLVLRNARGSLLEEAQRQLGEALPSLNCRRYGRAVLACMDSLSD